MSETKISIEQLINHPDLEESERKILLEALKEAEAAKRSKTEKSA